MATDQLQRPEFYEGQYLGAADLDAAVTYARLGHARHNLGAHTWGIAAGLQLREEPALSGGDAVDVFLQPGYAVDGFGRIIVVPVPVQLPAELFGDEDTGRVPVWIRYTEQTAGAPEFGFEVCTTDEARARVVENYEIVVGDVSDDERRDEVSVAGQFADAIEILHTLDAEAPLQCDGSVPFQEFPPPREANWLVPLGIVQWEAGPPSQLVASSEEVRRASRAARRYLGVVAEGVHAADGVIRLRDRATQPPAEGTSAFSACAEHAIRPDEDLVYDEDTERVYPTELVWVEGHLRVVGDARLFGGKLEFRDAEGEDHDAPLWIRRAETNAFDDPEGRDLQILLGGAADGRHRLVIGHVEADGTATDHVIVQNDGRVGLGTSNPTSELSKPLTVRGAGEALDVLGFEDGGGNLEWHLSLQPGGTPGLGIVETDLDEVRLFLRPGGNVGVGTTEPEAKLDLTGVRATSGGSALGADLWLRVGDGDDSGRFWVEYGSQGAPLLVLSDRDDPPRLQFQQTGNGDESGPDLSSWIGHARGNSSDLAVMNGNVGIGTLTPSAPLHIGTGTDASTSDSSGYLVIGDVNGLNLVLDNNEIMARSNGSVATLHLQADGGDLIVQGDVGIGTTSPRATLHVGTGSDASANDDAGYLVIGDIDGLNLVMDGDELMARSNGAVASLHLQRDGGSLVVHGNETAAERVTVTDTGQIGAGLLTPEAKLHVRDSINQAASSLSAHVAVLENESTGASADVLALRVGASNRGGSSNFITFFGGSSIVGRVEGTGGGVAFLTGSGDFAECLPRLHEDEAIEVGDVVGVIAGHVTKATDDTHHVMVVTGQPAVVGNAPPPSEEHRYERVAFLGQAPVNVCGPVRAGDYIVPSGRNDGTGIAVATPLATHARIVGRAWEASDETGVKRIRTAVGLDPGHATFTTLLRRQDKQIHALRAEVDSLKEVAYAYNGHAP